MSELASAASASNGSHAPDDRDTDLDAFVEPLILDEATLHTLAYQFSTVYQDLARHSDEQFLPTPVTRLPSGDETGQFLAIDVGGTNLRVAFVDLLGDEAEIDNAANGQERSIQKAQRPRVRRTLEKAWPIGEHLKMDKAEDLFAWIGDCIAEVVGDLLSSDAAKDIPDELEMGITFSFPMMQDEITSATLMPMGKGFAITSDLNLGELILAGYSRHTCRQSPSATPPPSKRRKLGPLPRLKIAAITNDTIATLASLAYCVKSLPNSRVAAGVIVGTGCNATIPMKFADLGDAKTAHIKARNPSATEAVVNTEITIAGACEPLKQYTTKWDKLLDAACARPGFQPLEYMTGGRYVGELVRTIFYDYMTQYHDPPIPPSSLPANIVHPYSLTTTFLSTYVATARSDAELSGEMKRRMPPPESSNWAWSPQSAGALRKIAHLVQLRSAGLIAASIVGLLATVREIAISDPHAASSGISPNKAQNQLELRPTPETALKPDEPNPINPLKRKMAKAKDNPESKARSDPPTLSPFPSAGLSSSSSWRAGPEELVIAFTGGIIQHYPHFKEQCQRFVDRLVMRAGVQEGGKSVFLRESRDGGVVGAGVLAGMVSKGEVGRG